MITTRAPDGANKQQQKRRHQQQQKHHQQKQQQLKSLKLAPLSTGIQ